MTRARLLASWVALLVGAVLIDVANDDRLQEAAAGLLLAISWHLAIRGRR